MSDEGVNPYDLSELASKHAKTGEFEKALEAARSIDVEYSRSYALRKIASELVKAGEPYKHILEEALEVARSIDDGCNQSWSLSSIAFELVKAGEPYKHILEDALEVARSIDDDRHRSWALEEITCELAEIAPELAKAGKLEEALEVARSIGDGRQRASALGKIASGLAKAGEPYKHILEEALEVTRSIDDNRRRSQALKGIASELAKAGEPYKHILEEALEVTRSWSDSLNIAPELAKAGKLEEALEVARNINDEYDRSFALGRIASELATAGEFEKALYIATRFGGWFRSYALREIVSELIKAGKFGKALEVARSINYKSERLGVLNEIASELAKAGEPYNHIFEEALEIARSIGDCGQRASALGKIASGLAKAGEPYKYIFEEALEVARNINYKSERSGVLNEIASELAKAGEPYNHIFEEALEAARSIDDEEDRLAALEEITPELVKASLWRNATGGAGSTPAPPSRITPPQTAPTTQFATLRTVWDPSNKDFVWGAGKPDEYGELPRIKRWIEGNNPNIYWFLLKIVNHADHPVTEWNVTLYTEHALTITEAHIDEKQVRIVKSDFDTDSNRNVCVVSIPPELGVSIPANGGRRSMYFKIDIRCEDALKMEFGVSGVAKLGKSPRVEVPIREKRFTYACKYGDFRNMYYGSIDALASMAVTNLQDSYNREIVRNFTNSFRLIRDFEKYCNDRHAESETLVEKLEVVHSSLKAAEPITKDEILPLVGENLGALQRMGAVEGQKERGMRMCEKLVELLHIAASKIK